MFWREGLRIPFNGTSSHQFSRNSVADVATKGTTPFHFAPVTPDRGAWRIQSSQSSSFTHLFRNERLQGRRQDEYLRYMVGPPINKNESINSCTNKDPSQAAAPSPTTVLSATPLKETHNCGNEEAHQSLDLNNTPPQKTRNKRPFLPRFLPQPAFPSPTSILSATPVKETENKEEGHQGLDLNTPPPQKARRKRHRPKVITEGKPKKTPKPSAPKQNRNKEKESVPKTTLKRHVIPPAGEGGVAESQGSKEGVKSSCRRALNFDLEYSPRERISAAAGSSAPFNLNLHPQPHDMCEVTFKNSPGPSKSTVQLGHGLELVVENTPAGVPFDINRSLTQMLNDYISLPQNSSSLPPIARNEPTKESIKDWDRKKSLERMPSYVHTQGADCTIIPAPDSSLDNQMCTRLSCLESGIQSASRTLSNPNNRLCAGLADVDPTEKGSKRAYSEIINAAHHPTYHLDPYFSFYSGSESIQDTSSADIRKKKRIDVRHNEVASSVPSSVMRAPGDHKTFNKLHFMASNSLCVGYPSTSSKVLPCIDAKRGGPVLNKIQDLKSMLIPSHTNITKRRSKTPVRIRKLASITVATEGHQLPPSHGNSFRNEIKAAQCLENPKQKKSIRKGPTIPVESLSCNSTNQAGLLGHEVETSDNCQSLVQSRGALCQKSFMPTSSSQTSRFGMVPINFVQEHQIKNATFGDRTIVSSKDFIEDIVQRLKYLDINQGDMVSAEVQYALPSHAVELQMVPYKGLFDPTKKRQRPRPKIDMDEETNRVWKLLMWKEGSDGHEGMDMEKEKRWEEERIAFRGRADSFIARMHLVQGDRRFSQWKGSVVDSVVGVFLTQNVSDHLSSSAFMALAAKFSLQPSTTNSRPEAERMSKSSEETVGSFLEYNKWQDEMLRQGVLDQGSFALREETVEKDKFSSIESFESNTGPRTENYSKGKQIAFYDNGPDVSQESPESQTEIPRALDDVVWSQNSVISFTDSNIQIVDQICPNYESSFEADNIVTGYRCNGLDGCDNISFTELLKMQGTKMLQDFYSGDKLIHPDVTVEGIEFPSRSSFDNGLVGHPSNFLANPQTPTKHEFMFHVGLDISSAELESVAMSADESSFSLPSSASEMTEGRDISCKDTIDKIAIGNVAETVILPSPSSQDVSIGDSYIPVPVSNHPVHLSHGSGPKTLAEASSQRRDSGMAQLSSPSYNYAERPLDVGECSILADNDRLRSSSNDLFNISEKGPSGTTNDRSIATRRKGGAEKNKAFDWDSLRRQVCLEASRKERTHDTMDSLDYEALRCADVNEIADTIKERGMNNMLAERIKAFLNRLVSEHGSIDLEWLRDVPPDKAKDFLLSIRGLGLKSVECVRLLTLHQLAFPVDTNVGRICVRLGWVPLQPLPESLQLHLLDLYPVQSSIQKYLWPRLCKLDQRTLYELHYQMITFGKVFCTKSNPNCNACPMRAECRHFASAFASARLALPGPKDKSLVASPAPVTPTLGRDHEVALNPLPLPPLENTSQSESSVPLMMTLAEANEVAINTLLLPPFEKAPLSEPQSGITVCEPIIEEPASPEPEILEDEISETAIEDAFWEDPDEIPTIKLNFEEFTLNVQNYIENNMQLHDGEMSKALVALSPEAASVPVPKLKNLSRLRTEHQVYQLPDSHPLLQGLDPREPDDPSPYLLAIWTPGETAQSIQPTELPCNSQESGNLCDENTCFACNGIREANAQTVRGTLLIPCRTAMRGSFPLNGTYFQVNEVFADHDSSLQPIDVPRALIWNLPRRTVFFGTSIPTIFRGLTTEGIQHCFWRGFVCVRGFDQKTRAPRPLMARLHFPAYKQMRAKKTPNKSPEKATKR